MEPNFQDHKSQMLVQIKDQYGKLVYSYTCHWNTANHLKTRSSIFQWLQIILSAVSAGGCIAAVVQDQSKLAWIGGVLSTLLLVVGGYLKDKDFDSERNAHISAANNLWMIREEYISLMTDFDSLGEPEIVVKRDALVKKTYKVYQTAPQTDKKSYSEAQKALKENEVQFFHSDELNCMLPEHLRR